MRKIMLNGVWNATRLTDNGASPLSFEGNVPGSVIRDLIHANIAPKDIFWRDNADQIQCYEKDNFRYSKTFSVDEICERMLLVFRHLDTYCDIYLNDEHIAYCEDDFLPHSFDVTKRLKKGENTITIDFYSPVTRVLGKRWMPAAFTTERVHTRRMQCTYGWDWVMRFVTCGVSGDVYIECGDNTLQVDHAYVYTRNVDADSATVGADIALKNYDDAGILTFKIFCPDGSLVAKRDKYCDEPVVRFRFDIANPKLWYPTGYGEQPLYTFAVFKQDQEIYSTMFGIRTVKLLELPDAPDSEYAQKCRTIKETPFSKEYDQNTEFSGFILVINGIHISAKGANWVPCEPFVSDLDKENEKITTLLELAKEAGVNMLRVWGGGKFETPHFYSECSRLGITVTQDFLMACGKYPEDEMTFLAALSEEAKYAAITLRNYPCLVWWSGDNENAINGCDTDTDYQGRRSALHAIGPVLRELDPYRDFLPSSPYGGKKYAGNTVGTTHNTQYLSYLFDSMANTDFTDYKDVLNLYNARFICEEGTMGAVSTLSLRKMMTEEDIFGDDDTMWTYHLRTNPGLPKHLIGYLYDFASKVLGNFENGADKVFKLQYCQYEWVRVTLERMRREKGFCNGLVYWMWNDCWAASAGWAFVDYYMLPKISYYSFKRAAKPLMMSINRENGAYRVYVCNDSLSEHTVDIRFYQYNIKTGAVHEISATKSFAVSANSVRILEDSVVPTHDNDTVLLARLYEDGEHIDTAFYKDGDLAIRKCAPDAYTVNVPSDTEIEITANTYIHALSIEADAVFDDNGFILLPGETKTVHITPRKEYSSSELAITAYTLKA